MLRRTVFWGTLVVFAVFCHGMYIREEESPSGGLGMLNPSWTYISNYSFTVAILVGIDLLGGGALIEQNWVLTAASVLRGFNASDIRVRVGSNSAYVDGKLHTPTAAFRHPMYSTNSTYNLALLKLDTPVYPKVATKVSYFARIPFQDNGVAGNVTGYGATSSSQANGQPGVQIAIGHVYTASYCRTNWRRTISGLHICAFSYYAVPCSGDEGDPLTRCWGDLGSQCELLGIATGYDKCDSYEPYALVDVGQFAPWILDTLHGNTTQE